MPKLHGKLCKHANVIFKEYSPTGKDYTCMICNPRDLETSPLTENEIKARKRFKLAHQQVHNMTEAERQTKLNLFTQQTKYKTFRGFLFAEVYKTITDEQLAAITLD